MKIIDKYLIKIFLLKFLQITAGFSLIIFFINFIETLDKAAKVDAPFYIIALMSFLRTPEIINDTVSSLVLITAIITFFSLSASSEITIIKSSGLLLWQIIRPITLTAFLLGVFWIFIFEPISIMMIAEYEKIENNYISLETELTLEPQNGIWLKQKNLEKPGEEIIINAKKIYKNHPQLDDINIWFIDQNGSFYERIDASSMIMKNGVWSLTNVVKNDINKINELGENIEIKTELDKDFIMSKVIRNLQDVKLFSIFTLPSLIQEMKNSGFQSRKFEVRLHSLISKPILFVAMVLISCYFGLNHIRNHNSALMIFSGIAFGLLLYVTSNVVNSFGASGLISVFASTWIISLVCLAIGVLLIYQKEKL